jgi:hypothetical protein
MRDSAGPVSNRLCARVLRDQWLNIGFLLPGVFVLNLGFLFAVRNWPEFFLARNGHVWLIAAQIVAFVGYLIYVVRFYVDLAPLISEARAEWRGTGGDADRG